MEADSLTATLRETLAIFDGYGEPRTTPEIADRLDLGRRTTYARLERLVEQNRLETKKVGANARVWWRPPAGSDAVTANWSAALVDEVLDDVEVGIFVLDETFEVAWINAATERYFGLDREHVVGRDKRHLVDERIASTFENSTEFTETILATYDDDADAERFECHVMADDEREERWLEYRSTSIESGVYAGGRVELYYDITDRKRSERTREEFTSLVEAVEKYGIFTLDPEGYVRTWNPGAERIKGYGSDDIIGEHVSVFYTDDDREAGVPEGNLKTAADDGSIQDEGWRIRNDGSRFWANVTITAIRDENGTLQGYAKVTHDTTERRERERQLRRERDLTERILETAPVTLGIFQVDGSIERINSQTRYQLGIGEETGSEFHIEDIDLYGADGTPVSAANNPALRVIETGETVTDWLVQHDGPNGDRQWFSLTVAPLTDDDGTVERIVVAGKDVTELKRKERQLERQRDGLKRELSEVFERVSDGFYALDENLRFLYLNDHAADVLGLDESVIGEDFRGVVTFTDAFQGALYEALETQQPVVFEDYYDPVGRWFYNALYPSDSGLSVYFREITENKKRERQLEQYERMVETVNDGVYATDGEGHFVFVNDAFVSMSEYTRAELLGSHGSTYFGERFVRTDDEEWSELIDGEHDSVEFETEIIGPDGEIQTVHNRFVPLETGNEMGRVGVTRDITDRIDRERELRDTKTQLEAATEAGEVGTWEWHIPGDRFVTGTWFAERFGVDPEAAREGVSIEEFVSAIHEDDRDRVKAEIEAAVSSCGAYESEYRVWSADDECRWVVARGRVECDEDGSPVTFPGALTDITRRKRAEIELERQLGQLVALHSITDIVSEITEAVIGRSTREEIEQAACDALAAADAYEFAWLAAVDSATDTFEPRATAGTRGYEDRITVSIDPDDPGSKGPGATAIREQETQVVRDVFVDPAFEPWREVAAEYGFNAVAAIPIVHEGTVYGVLGVYADRPKAFDTAERSVISKLGRVIGHAIAAGERKRALMSDELIELEFQIQDVFTALDVPVETEGTIRFDHTVPIGADEFLVYGTASPEAIDTVAGLVETLTHWKEVTVSSHGDPISFELRQTDHPVLAVIASLGGYVDRAVIEDGDYQMRIHTPPSVEVSRLLDAIEETYPQVEMLRRQQITRPRDDLQRVQRRIVAELTDRQLTTLDTAYHSGFFEWPRETSGEDVAESMGVAPPTFHQHLRKGEKKVFDALFSTDIHRVG